MLRIPSSTALPLQSTPEQNSTESAPKQEEGLASTFNAALHDYRSVAAALQATETVKNPYVNADHWADDLESDSDPVSQESQVKHEYVNGSGDLADRESRFIPLSQLKVARVAGKSQSARELSVPGQSINNPNYGTPTVHLASRIDIFLREKTGKKQYYFFEQLSEKQAFELLTQNSEHNLFLFRASSQKDCFVLNWKKGGKICSPVLLKFDGQKVCVVVKGEARPTYENMEELYQQIMMSSGILLGVSDVRKRDPVRTSTIEELSPKGGEILLNLRNRPNIGVPYLPLKGEDCGIAIVQSLYIDPVSTVPAVSLSEKINNLLQEIMGQKKNFIFKKMSDEGAQQLLFQDPRHNLYLFREGNESYTFILNQKNMRPIVLKFDGQEVCIMRGNAIIRTFESLKAFLQQPILSSSFLLAVGDIQTIKTRINRLLQEITGQKKSFLFKEMSKEAAEKLLLKAQEPDTFLFREGSDGVTFVIEHKNNGKYMNPVMLQFLGQQIGILQQDNTVNRMAESLQALMGEWWLSKSVLLATQEQGVHNA